jgi:hypothetical protein
MPKRTSKKALHAGVSVMDITPPVGYLLQGHAARNKPSEGVHDPLKMKVLTLFDGTRRVALVTADLLGFDDGFLDGLRPLLKKRCGMSAHDVMLSASHTHTGPCIDFASTSIPPDHILPSYVRLLQEKLVGGIREASLREEPVSVRYAETRTNIGAINRRKPTPAGVEFAPYPDGFIDDQVNILSFDRSDGSPLAVVFRYSCHPTTLGADVLQISADYPGVAQRQIEKALPDATAFFVQGCSGEVRPAIIEDGQFAGGTFNDIERLGRKLARCVLRTRKDATPVRGRTVAARRATMRLPFQRRLLPASAKDLPALSRQYSEDIGEEFAEMGFARKWAAHWRREFQAGNPIPTGVPIRMHALRIGDVTLIGLGVEVMAEYGPWLRERLGGRVVALGYVDGDRCYLPTRDALAQGGYEGAAHVFAPFPAPFSPSLQERVLRTAERLADSVRQPPV